MKGVVGTDTKSLWKWVVSKSTGEGTTLVGKGISHGSRVGVLMLPYTCPGTEQLGEQTLGGGSQFLPVGGELTEKPEEETRVVHGVMDSEADISVNSWLS